MLIKKSGRAKGKNMNLIRLIIIIYIALILSISVDAQSINTIKQQCQTPFASSYGSIKVTAAGDLVFAPCPTKGFIGLPAGLVSPLTTKGDIWGFSNVDARIPVGANGTVLTADSTNVLGVAWAASSSISGLTTGRLTFGNSATSISSSDLIGTAGVFSPSTAGGFAVGTNALPFSSFFVGNAATNNIQLTGTATGVRTATFPDASGTVLLAPIGLTPNFIPRAISAGTIGDTPFSWNSTLYKFDNTANNSNFRMELTPNNVTGVFDVGDLSYTSFPFPVTNHILIDQANNVINIAGKDFVGLYANAGGGGNRIDVDGSSNSISMLSQSSATLESAVVTIQSYPSGNGLIHLNGATKTLTMDMRAGGIVTMGDITPVGTGTKFTLSDTASSFTFGNTANTALLDLSGVGTLRFKDAMAITPTTAGAGNNIGTTALPFSSLFIGAAATNNINLIGTATAARTITLPDATGTVALQGGSGTISGLTVNKVPKAASATTLSDSRITDNSGVGLLLLDGGAGITSMGDVSSVGNDTLITVSDATELIDLHTNTSSGLINADTSAFNADTNAGTFMAGDLNVVANGTAFTISDALRQFIFNIGIIKMNNDCAGLVTLDGAGQFDLSATDCDNLADGTPIALVTGRDTTGILTVNGALTIISSAGGGDAGNVVQYWIIDTP